MRIRQVFRFLLAAVAAIAVSTLPQEAARAQSGVVATRPATGLATGPEVRVADNVFVIPDKTARSISGWLVVLAGCADEADGTCVGIAHYLEHLLFISRDSEHRSKVSYFADGAGNGWTTHRTTTYYQRFPSRAQTDPENLDKLIGYFSGLLAEVTASGPLAERERNVVLQEYQQNTGRNPFARFSIRLNASLMPNEPLGQRVIGSPETIAAFTAQAAKAFHARWYGRNNAVIILHGPVEPEQIAALVAKHVSVLPAKTIPRHDWKTQRSYAPGRQELRITDKDARQVAVSLEQLVTFDEPAGQRADNDAAHAVLAGYLASRLADSPLETLMERDGLVTDARLSISRVRDGTLRLSFSAVPANGIAPETLIDAARTYVMNLSRTGLSEAVVDRLKLRIRNERALLAEQPALYAQALMNWISGHGSYQDWKERSRRHDAVRAADVNRLISIIAGPGREVAGIILPGATVTAGRTQDSSGTTLPVPSADSGPQRPEPQ